MKRYSKNWENYCSVQIVSSKAVGCETNVSIPLQLLVDQWQRHLHVMCNLWVAK